MTRAWLLALTTAALGLSGRAALAACSADSKSACIEITDLPQSINEGEDGTLRIRVRNIPKGGTFCAPRPRQPTKGWVRLLWWRQQEGDLDGQSAPALYVEPGADRKAVWQFRMWPKNAAIPLEGGTWTMQVACSGGVGRDDRKLQVDVCPWPPPSATSHRRVRAETDVGPGQDSIVMTLICPDNREPHFVQFVKREMTPPETGWYGVSCRDDPGRVCGCHEFGQWRTDGQPPPSTRPYYDAYDSHTSPPAQPSGTTQRDACALSIIDRPSFNPNKTVFEDTTCSADRKRQSAYRRSTATFKTFAICDNRVVAQIDWSRVDVDEEVGGKLSSYRYYPRPFVQGPPDRRVIDRFRQITIDDPDYDPWLPPQP